MPRARYPTIRVPLCLSVILLCFGASTLQAQLPFLDGLFKNVKEVRVGLGCWDAEPLLSQTCTFSKAGLNVGVVIRTATFGLGGPDPRVDYDSTRVKAVHGSTGSSEYTITKRERKLGFFGIIDLELGYSQVGSLGTPEGSEFELRGSVRELPYVSGYTEIQYRDPACKNDKDKCDVFPLSIFGGVRVGIAQLHDPQLLAPAVLSAETPADSPLVGSSDQYVGTGSTLQAGITGGVRLTLLGLRPWVELTYFFDRDIESLRWAGQSTKQIRADFPTTFDLEGWQWTVGFGAPFGS